MPGSSCCEKEVVTVRGGRIWLGNLLLLIGALLVLLPAARWLRDEIDHRRQMAEALPPSPVMLARPGEPGADGSEPSGPPGAGPADGSGDDAGEGAGEGAGGGSGGGARDGAGAEPFSDPATGGTTRDWPPAPLYHIAIPRLGVSYAVNEGVDNPVLDLGPGHYPQTVLPGEVGNAAMAGHRTRFGRPSFFYDLDALEPGDLLHIEYPDRSLTFVVERVFITDPYDLSVIAPTDYPSLTLTTCDPPGTDEMRLIVQARLQSPLAAETPPG